MHDCWRLMRDLSGSQAPLHDTERSDAAKSCHKVVSAEMPCLTAQG